MSLKYIGAKCFVSICNNPAEYEGGDARFYCGMCEEHTMIKEQYEWYKEDKESKKYECL